MEKCYCALLVGDDGRYTEFYFYSEHEAGSHANQLDCMRAMRRQKGYSFAGNHRIEFISLCEK